MSQYPAGTPGSPGSSPLAQGGNTRLLLAALLLAIVAVVLVNLYVQSVRIGATETGFTVFMLRVSKEPGEVLEERDVTAATVPERFRDAFAAAVAGNERSQPVRLGDRFTRAAPAGEFLRETFFDDVTQDDVFQLYRLGMRGVAIPVDRGMLPQPLRPEMFVDLEAAFAVPGGDSAIIPVMEHIRVVAVGSNTRLGGARGGGSGGEVTVEVTPLQATQLSAIARRINGGFIVHLRRAEDREPVKIPQGGINPDALRRAGIVAEGD